MVAVKTREDARDNPYAHLQLDIAVEDAMKSAPVVTPLKLLDCCPTKDAAAVFASEDRAGKITGRPAWIKSVATCSEKSYCPGMDMVSPVSLQVTAKKAYDRAGIVDPVREINVAELYVAFTSQEMIWA